MYFMISHFLYKIVVYTNIVAEFEDCTIVVHTFLGLPWIADSGASNPIPKQIARQGRTNFKNINERQSAYFKFLSPCALPVKPLCQNSVSLSLISCHFEA